MKRSILFSLLLFISAFTFSTDSILTAQTWGSFSTANGLSDNQIRSMTVDSAGTLWIGTRTKGIQSFNGTSFSAYPRNLSFGIVSGNVDEITGLGYINGRMFIGTKSSSSSGKGGLWIDNGSSVQFIGDLAIFPSAGDITSFHKAKDGTIYAGAGAGFFKRVADNNWTRIGYGYVKSIAEKADSTILYTTFDSLYTYKNGVLKGILKGTFQSVLLDKNENIYLSDLSTVRRFNGTKWDTLINGSYSKAMALDKNGRVWIASAGNLGGFGLKVYDGNNVTTYISPGTPLLSSDMTTLKVLPNNMKVMGHYSAGMNTLMDSAFVVALSISPSKANVLLGKSLQFTAADGTAPYTWGVRPVNAGTIDGTGKFTAQKAGAAIVFAVSSGKTDTAKASVTVQDTLVIRTYAPPTFTVTKGKYPSKIGLNWTTPGEFKEGFEDGIPPLWTIKTEGGVETGFIESTFLPFAGTKCIKFDLYSPGKPVNDWLISAKITVTPEKPNLRIYYKTAFALGNPYSSYIKLSTTTPDTAAFTTVLKEFTPAILVDSLLKWRSTVINLSSYMNQEVYLAFNCKAEDIIIYFDEMELIGQPGPTSIANAVKSFKLYRGASSGDLKNSGTVIGSPLKGTTSFIDSLVTPFTNYYYAVSAVFDSLGVDKESALSPAVLGIAYSQSDSLVFSSSNGAAPVVDGMINAGEYTGALKVPMTKSGYYGDLYLKTVGRKLYAAVDCFEDPTASTGDFMLFAFDANRDFLYSEGTEGYFSIGHTGTTIQVAFFPWGSLGFGGGILNPTGVKGAMGDSKGNLQFEMAIDMDSSFLKITPPQRIGAFVSIYDPSLKISPSWLERAPAGEYSILSFGSMTFTNSLGVHDRSSVITEYGLSQNYPNPFNPVTTIQYQVPSAGPVTLKVYDVLGKEVAALVNEQKNAGSYAVRFNGAELSSGVYYYTIQAGTFTETKKLMLLK
ncbi:MAG: T9SS type A sorting domain-containing protein [Bacteroidota bacterium]